MSNRDGDEELLDLHAFMNSPGAQLSVTELCTVPGLTLNLLSEMVAFGIVEPSSGSSPAHWQFSIGAAQRSLQALRLQHDLELNLAGAALVLELLDDLHQARTRLRALEQLLG